MPRAPESERGSSATERQREKAKRENVRLVVLTQPRLAQVMCEGTLDTRNARFVGPRVKSVCGLTKNGYLLIVPLLPADGSPPCCSTAAG